MENAAKLIEAITQLIVALVNLFGVGGTILIIIACAVGTLLWRLYLNKRKDSANEKLIKEKDNTIARMKEEIKMYRIEHFKNKGWSEEEIEKYVK